MHRQATHARKDDGEPNRVSPPLKRIATAWRSLPGLRGDIGLRLLVRVLLFSSVVTLLLTSMQLYLDYRRDVAAVDQRISEIDSGYRRSLGEGLWRLDARQLQLQVEGILRLPDIRYVELREATDRAAPLVVSAGSRQANPPARREFEIFYTNRGAEQLVGILMVEATFERIYRQLFDTAAVILAGQAIKTFIVSFFILLIVHRLITRHLTGIATSLRGYDLHGSQTPLRLDRRPPRSADELDGLAEAFNDMYARLQAAYDDLAEREARIRRLVDSNIIGIFIWDFEGRILEANDEFLRMVNYDRDDLVAGRIRWAELTPPDWRERNNTRIEQQKTSGRFEPFEKEFTRRDGNRVPILIGGATFEEGGDQGVAFVLDLTERKRAEQALRESEYKLRQIIETIPSLVWSADPNFEPTHLNQRHLDYYGLQFEDFKRGGWMALQHPDDLPETVKAISQAVQTGTSFQAVHRIRRADGEFRWHDSRGAPLRDRQGNIIQWYGLTVDIDEAKKAEDRLRRSEAYLAEAQRLSHTGSAAYNETEILYWSEEASRIWGFDPLQGVPSREAVWRRIHPDDLDSVNENIEHGVREKRSVANEFRIILPDGTVKYLEATNNPVFAASGELLEINVTGVDVTERKCAEQTLREREAQLAEARRELRQMIDTIPIPVASYSPEARRDFVNAAWKQYTGLSDEAALGTEWSVVAHPDHIAAGERMWREALATGEPWHTEERVRRADGQYRWFAIDRVAARDESGKIVKWYGTAYDIEDRKQAEQALRESERSARSTIDGIAGLVAVLAPNGEVETVNRQLLEYFGQPVEWIKNWGTNDAVHPEDLPRVLELFKRGMASGIPYNQEFRIRRFDGEYRWFENRHVPIRDDSGRIARWYNLLTDIEDRKQALAQLEQMQSDFAHINRVSMMGELVASLSHEISQPIASAHIYACAAQNFLDMQPPDLSEVREALAGIVGNAERAGDIIGRIREQIRKAPARKEQFDLNAAIDEVIGLGRSAIIKNRVWVQTRLSEGLSPVHGDRVQLQQVVLNLLLNALEAMGSVEEAPRELLISTRQDHTGVLVAVHDSGPGIDPEHLERVFDSFYTTKPSGTGMGLSICRSIVDAHGGRLWAEANEPRGTIFQFTLPAT